MNKRMRNIQDIADIDLVCSLQIVQNLLMNILRIFVDVVDVDIVDVVVVDVVVVVVVVVVLVVDDVFAVVGVVHRLLMSLNILVQ